MIKTTGFLTNENIDLTNEISLIAPTDTPFYSYLMSAGRYEKGISTVTSWREKTLDDTDDISFVEGSETDVFQESGRAEKSNIQQIFKKAVSISGSADASKVLGINDLFAEEVNDRATEMKVNVERALINGLLNDGSTTPFVRKMRGLIDFSDTDNQITVAGGKVVEQGDIDNLVRKLWEKGMGVGEYTLMVNADIKGEIDSFYEKNYIYNAEMKKFGLVVQTIQTNFGNVNILLNRHMPVDKAVLFDPRFIKLSYLRTPRVEPLSKTGDNIKAQIITELTLKVMNEKSVAVLTKTA